MNCKCPECYFEFVIEEDLMIGEIVECPDCAIQLEVIEKNNGGIVFEVAQLEEEDWGE
ncbi:MAG: lysine biosynthesis protein LysW [Candidatus Jordarchaeum sp.]|uniref:lysine biosynthesis protein LysW n=1 Tax=Candidatus Jordarchaeum sp. TaxID=2823881 RepID=UPI0040497969